MFVMLSLYVTFAKPVMNHFIAPLERYNCKDYVSFMVFIYTSKNTAQLPMYGETPYQVYQLADLQNIAYSILHVV